MAARTCPGVGGKKRMEGLLVTERRMEYSRDRLEAQIRQLEYKIIDLQLEHDAQRSRAMVAEVVLCILCGALGYGLGVWLG
jgi:hypothetical protein